MQLNYLRNKLHVYTEKIIYVYTSFWINESINLLNLLEK